MRAQFILLAVLTGLALGGCVRSPPLAPAPDPAGPYMLFIDKSSPSGLIPSTAMQTFVGAGVPGWVGTTAAAPALQVHSSTTSAQSSSAAGASRAGAAAPQTGVVGAAGANPAAGLDSRLAASTVDGTRDRPLVGVVAAMVAIALAVLAARRRISARRRN